VRRWMLCGLAGLLLINMVSCGSNSEGENNASGSSGSQKVRVMCWSSEEELALHKQATDEFTKQKGIEVEWLAVPSGDYANKTRAMFLSNDVYDSINTGIADYYLPYIDAGFYSPLNPYIEKDPEMDINNYPENLIKAYTHTDGNIYALPKDYVPHGLFYNRTLFDEAGIPYPDENTTWDDFYDMAAKLTKDDQWGCLIDTWNESIEVYWMMGGGGPGLVNNFEQDKVTLDDPANIPGLEFTKKLIDNGYTPSPAQLENTEGNLFAAGKIAMMPGGSLNIPTFLATEGLDYSIAPLPQSANGTRKGCLWTSGYAMAEAGKNKENTWEFIKWMTYGEGSAMLANTGFSFPSTAPKQHAECFLFEENIAHGGQVLSDWGSVYGVTPQRGINEVELNAKFTEMLDRYYLNDEDLDSLIAEYQVALEEIFNRK
jgi:multiple sugar transport system substrate-binding protein